LIILTWVILIFPTQLLAQIRHVIINPISGNKKNDNVIRAILLREWVWLLYMILVLEQLDGKPEELSKIEVLN